MTPQEEQLILLEFQQITRLDRDNALRLLLQFDFHLENALAAHFGQQDAAPASPSQAASPILTTSPTQTARARPRAWAALLLGRALALLRWLLAPVWRWVANGGQYRALPHSGAGAGASPAAAAARFAAAFDADADGAPGPTWFIGSYSQALEKARSDIQYLLVYIQSSEHDDAAGFERDVLRSEALNSLVTANDVLAWGGNVAEAEAFQVAAALGATRFPFLVLIFPQGGRMAVAERVEGRYSAAAVVGTLQRALDRVNRDVDVRRRERALRDAERRMREQQNEAYEASLRADQEKDRRAREAKEARIAEAARAEQARIDAERHLEARRAHKAACRAALDQTPEPERLPDGPPLVRISLRLPGGDRVVRAFQPTDTLSAVYDFADAHDLMPIPLSAALLLVSSYPRREYRDRSQTLSSAGLLGTVALLVEAA